MKNESTNTIEVPGWFAEAEPVLGPERLSALRTHVEAIGAEIRAARATIDSRQAELDSVGERVREAVRLSLARDAEILRTLGLPAAITIPAPSTEAGPLQRLAAAARDHHDRAVEEVLSRPTGKKPTQTFGLWVSNLRRAATRLKVELPAEIKPEYPWKDWHEGGETAADTVSLWEEFRDTQPGTGEEGEEQGGEEARPEGVKTGENAADSAGDGGEEETTRQRTIRELPEDLRPLMDDPAVNDNGVYVDAERVAVPLPKGVKAEVELKVAKGTDDRWRGCYSVSFRTGNMAGVSGPVSVHDVGHVTRDLALAYAARYVLDWVGRQDNDSARKVAEAVEAYVATLDVMSAASGTVATDAATVLVLNPGRPLDADLTYEPFDLGLNAGEIAAAEQTDRVNAAAGKGEPALLTVIVRIVVEAFDYVALAHPTEPRGTFTLRRLLPAGTTLAWSLVGDPYAGRTAAIGTAEGLDLQMIGGPDDEILVLDKGVTKFDAPALPGGILDIEALGGVTWEQILGTFATEKIKRGDPAKVPAPVVLFGRSFLYMGLTSRGAGGAKVARLVELLPVAGLTPERVAELKENPSGSFCGRSVVAPDSTVYVMGPEAGDVLVRPPAEPAKPVKGRRVAAAAK